MENLKYRESSPENKSEQFSTADLAKEISILPEGSPQKKRALLQLENSFKQAKNIENAPLTAALDNLDDTSRQEVVRFLVDEYGLKDKVVLEDMTRKKLVIEFPDSPIKRSPQHGWVLKYKVLASQEEVKVGGKMVKEWQIHPNTNNSFKELYFHSLALKEKSRYISRNEGAQKNSQDTANIKKAA